MAVMSWGVSRVLGGFLATRGGSAQDAAAPYTAPRHQQRVQRASGRGRRRRSSSASGRTPHPDDQGLVQQAPLAEVGEERREAGVGLRQQLALEPGEVVAVGVPGRVRVRRPRKGACGSRPPPAGGPGAGSGRRCSGRRRRASRRFPVDGEGAPGRRARRDGRSARCWKGPARAVTSALQPVHACR